MKKLILSLIILISALFMEIHAQEGRSGKIGIGYSGNPSSQSNELGLSYWLSDNITLEPQVGIKHIELEDNSGTAWKLGVGILFRLNEMVVAPYIGGRIKTAILSSEDESFNDLIISLVFGGDYFISEWFSVGAEMKLNYVDTDDDFSPVYGIAKASIIETEQVLNIRVYF